ncbi:PEP-CTERM sorting domain-containing protein [Prosthecobacter sp. SYSU 5D2]|uniref:PEP-CTERM sorting domain-containing protein n=1 Tax=Prosthecobacter sp. SYSU 5D2 TaxID=3134134 RepID=UPI0031FF0992
MTNHSNTCAHRLRFSAHLPILFSSLLSIYLLLPHGSCALEINLTATGDWLNTANWSSGTLPGTADRANVINGHTATLSGDGGTINALRIGFGSNGTLIIDGSGGGALTINDSNGNGADTLIATAGTTGLLQIINGGTLASNNAGADGEIIIGQGTGSSGTLLLDEGSITAARGFYLGEGSQDATGEATIGDGIGTGDAILNTSGGNLEVGSAGSGKLTVNADALININSNNIVIAQSLGSSGEMILNGGTVTLNATGDINMNSGDSIFTMNGGSINARAVNMTNHEQASAVLNLNGGMLTTSQDITEGPGTTSINYNGSQLIIEGGDISTRSLHVGTAQALTSSLVMNLTSAASAQGDVQTQTFTVAAGMTLGSAGVDTTVNINNGFLDVRAGIRDGGSVTALNVGTAGTAGQLIIQGISPAVSVSSQLDSFSLGANGTLTARPNAYGINAIQTAAANLTGGTFVLDVTAFGAATSLPAYESVWIGGDGEWGASLTTWDAGQPEGYTLTANTQMTVVSSATPITGVVTLSTPGWTLVDNGSSTGTVIISNDASLSAGPVRAVLAGSDGTVAQIVRNTDLIISNSVNSGFIGSASAAHLEILGSAGLTVNADVYVGGASQGTVDQSGNMTVNGNLYFGQNPAGGDQGGTWNLYNGVTLTVTGDLLERAVSTSNAQLYIRGGTLDVAGDITVQRLDLGALSGQNSVLDIKEGQTVTSTGTTQIGAASPGIVNVTHETSVLQAANLTLGAGNANGSSLNVSAGLAGTFSGNLVVGSNGGGQNRPNLIISGTGTVHVSNSGDINTVSGNADLVINAAILSTISLSQQGSLSIARDFLLHNNTTANHRAQVIMADEASLSINRDLNYRDGTSQVLVRGGSLSVGRDLLLDSPAAAGSSLRIEGALGSLSITRHFTHAAGNLLSFAPLGGGLSTIQLTGASSIATLAGDIEVDIASFTDAATALATTSIWNTGSGTWTGSDAEWSGSTGTAFNPDGAGVLDTGDRFTILEVLGASGSIVNSATLLTPDWTLDTTTDPAKADLVYSGASLDSLPVHAILSAESAGVPVVIERNTDLVVAPVAGSSAAQLTIEDDVTLNITDGTLDGTGPHLIIGSSSATALATQNGGQVNGDGNLIFGVGGSSKGGQYDLFGGTLHVHGDVVEGGTGGVDSSVDTAQLYVDGGTLIVEGDITVQSFRVGNLAGKTGSYTQNNVNQTLTNTGTFYIAESGTGTYALQNGFMVLTTTEVANSTGSTGTWNIQGGKVSAGTTNIGRNGTGLVEITGVAAGEVHTFGAVNIGLSNSDTSVGHMVIDMPNAEDAVNTARIIVGNGGKGSLELISGTLNSGNGIYLANDANSNASNGRISTFIIGDGLSEPVLNISGANLETAVSGTGVITMNSGTYNQLTNNLIIGQGVGSDATFNMNGGEVNILSLLRISNNGKGLLNFTGGIMNVTGLIDIGNTANTDADGRIQMSGGVLNANNGLTIATQAGTLGSVSLSGGQLIVTGTTIVGSSGEGSLTITGVAEGQQHQFGIINIGASNNDSSSGTVLIDMADPTDAITIAGALNIGNSGKASFTFIEGTINATTGFTNAANVNSNEANGRTAIVIIGDGTSTPTLNISGDNFEAADNGTGIVTMNSGTLNQTNNNLIIGQTSTSDGTFNLNGGTLNITNMVRVGNSAGGTGTFNVAGGDVFASTLDFGANNGTGSFHTYHQTGGNVEVSSFLIARGTHSTTITAGSLSTGSMDLHAFPSDPGATLEFLGGDIGITNNLNFRTGRTVLTVGGTADLSIGGNLLLNAGGTTAEPSKFIVSGQEASITVTGNLVMTGTDERYLSFIPDAASPTLVSALEVSGDVTAAGTLELLDWGTLLSSSSTYGTITLINNLGSNPVNGTFYQTSGTLWNEGDFWHHVYADNSSWQLSYQGGDGNDITLTAVIVPEPSRLLLLVLAVIMMGNRRRRLG